MPQLAMLEGQVQLVALSIGSRVARIHEALYHLASLGAALFGATPRDEAAIASWIAGEGFTVDPTGGFFERAPHLARVRAATAAGTKADPAVDPMSFLWPPSRANNATTRAHLYALRGLGPELQALRGRFPEVVWIYYQDDSNATLIAPALDGVTAIPPEFDWHEYHSFQAVEPAKNPEGAIRWSPPNIDYGGHGLILCASIPVVHAGRFVGVWSMDVPLDSVLRDALSAPVAGGEHFIVDYEGNLIAHPAITSVIAREGGSVYRERLSVLGGGFVDLDLAPLIAAGGGQLELLDSRGAPVRVMVRAIPEIRWLLVAVFQTDQLVAARTRAMQEALARVGQGDLSVRLVSEGRDELDVLARSYNEMASSLADAVTAQTAAEQALREQLELVSLQRAEIEALSSPVIEVGEGVLAVPLIGSLRRERAAALVECVLGEVTRVRARAVLLDLTGVEAVDAAAIEGVLGLVRAVRLLGARCALSGLSPTAAQTLVEGDAAIDGLECHATLKQALAAVSGRTRR